MPRPMLVDAAVKLGVDGDEVRTNCGTGLSILITLWNFLRLLHLPDACFGASGAR